MRIGGVPASVRSLPERVRRGARAACEGAALPGSEVRTLRDLGVVAIAGLVLGILTSIGAGHVPASVSSVANSSGSWCLVAFGLALMTRRPGVGAILGFVALLSLLLGYALATILRGFDVGTALLGFWGAAAVVVGPLLGPGAVWTRQRRPYRSALGVGLLAGILTGEGIYGLTVVADTTSPVYWSGELVVGVALVVVLCWRRLRRPRPILACVATTAVVGGMFVLVYAADLLGKL